MKSMSPCVPRAAAMASILTCSLTAIAAAQAAGSAAGIVVAAGGVPVAGASVTFSGSAGAVTITSDSHGRFLVRALRPGTYVITASARGYERLEGRTIDVRPGQIASVELTLARSTSSLSVIGSVRANGGETLSTSSAPAHELDAQAFAQNGTPSVSDMLQGVWGVTVLRPAGGNAAAPAPASVRGPDPTETAIDIDGHQVNNANSGDFDLSPLDPADFSSVQIVYGISPSSLIDPNTIGGAINIRTLDPTEQPQGLVRFSAGSFGTCGQTATATGTDDKTGYALAFHRLTSQGEVAGGEIDAGSALFKARYTLGAGAFAQVSLRDQTVFKDESAALTTFGPGGFADFSGSSLSAHDGEYGFDVQVPLSKNASSGAATTTATLRHLTSVISQTVTGPALGTSPYFLDDRDAIGDDIFELDRAVHDGEISAKLALRSETLQTQLPAAPPADQARFTLGGAASADSPVTPIPALSQTERSAALRYTFDPTPHLHYAAAAYYTAFDRYGSSVDPRAGIVWTPDARSALRFSAGTTFQAPQLVELYVPAQLPAPDGNGHIDIGNPNLKPDRATEYDLGYEHLFGDGARRTHVAVDVYRTNLREPAQRYIPPLTCAPGSSTPPQQCESYPINVGGAVYQGMELRLDRSFGAQNTLHASYDVDSTFPTSVPAQVQNGSLVAGQQFLGMPLHRAALSFERRTANVDVDAGLQYEGVNNPLNRPAFVTAGASATWHLARFDLTLAGTNLTNVYDQRYTQAGFGVPYPGAGGPIPTDAYSLTGTAFTLSLTQHL